MPVFKLTSLFQYTSAVSTPNSPIHRTAGFSESWYQNAASAQAVLNAAQFTIPGLNPLGLWPARAALLPIGTSIVGFRVQQVSPLGPSQAGVVSFSGQAGVLADIPQMALLCKAGGIGVNNIRRFTLRAVPDVAIVEGEAQFSASYQTALNQFLSVLGFWAFRGRDLSQPTTKIVTVTPGTGLIGVVATETPVTYNVGDMVRILRTLDSGRNLRGGRFQVTVVGPGNSFTIANWPFSATTGGSTRKDAVVYPAVDPSNTSFGRAVVRRVGRPFVAFRGRRAKRR